MSLTFRRVGRLKRSLTFPPPPPPVLIVYPTAAVFCHLAVALCERECLFERAVQTPLFPSLIPFQNASLSQPHSSLFFFMPFSFARKTNKSVSLVSVRPVKSVTCCRAANAANATAAAGVLKGSHFVRAGGPTTGSMTPVDAVQRPA